MGFLVFCGLVAVLWFRLRGPVFGTAGFFVVPFGIVVCLHGRLALGKFPLTPTFFSSSVVVSSLELLETDKMEG